MIPLLIQQRGSYALYTSISALVLTQQRIGIGIALLVAVKPGHTQYNPGVIVRMRLHLRLDVRQAAVKVPVGCLHKAEHAFHIGCIR